MQLPTHEKSPLVYARFAGVCYLIIILAGVFGEGFVRSSIIVSGDAAATAANVIASQGLFRAGFIADCLMLVSDVAIAILLYELLRPVSRVLSLTAAAFRLTQAAVLGLNLLHYYGAAILLKGNSYTEAFEPGTLNGLALLMLDIHAHGYDLGLIFFAFTCAIQGYLVVKSTYFPDWIGYGLAAAGVVYLIGSLTRFLLPEFMSMLTPIYLVPLVAELSFCMFLLIKGVKTNG